MRAPFMLEMQVFLQLMCLFVDLFMALVQIFLLMMEVFVHILVCLVQMAVYIYVGVMEVFLYILPAVVEMLAHIVIVDLKPVLDAMPKVVLIALQTFRQIQNVLGVAFREILGIRARMSFHLFQFLFDLFVFHECPPLGLFSLNFK